MRNFKKNLIKNYLIFKLDYANVNITFFIAFIVIASTLFQSDPAYALRLKSKKTFSDIIKIENEKVILEAMSEKEGIEELAEVIKAEDSDGNYLKYLYAKEDCSNSYAKSLMIENLQNHYININSLLLNSLNNKNIEKSKRKVWSNSEIDFRHFRYLIRDKSTSNKQVVGYIGVYDYDIDDNDIDNDDNDDEDGDGGRPPQVVIYVSKKYSGHGLGHEATAALVQMVKDNFDTKRIFWECDKKNLASANLAQKFKFKLYKKDGNSEVYRLGWE
ncbi:MAG: GNAT family N-acetyltransferase [Oligoflexia bacterium]|nr:GNAT family N-acetyltransferase [Oligoflexia bacterium]